ncbi:MAG: AI-2E family transporter [Alphaproteobacteria bacterium]|nr:AI-2E family transporter [Alphaproteobacteria bacterium]
MEQSTDKYFRIVTVGLALALLAWGCFSVLSPFIPALVWGAILCLTTWPGYVWLEKKLKVHSVLAAFGMTLVVALCFIVPLLFLGSSAADNFSSVHKLLLEAFGERSETPPEWLVTLPIIGSYLGEFWDEYLTSAADLQTLVQTHGTAVSQFFISAGAAIGRGLTDLSLGILLAFFFFLYGHTFVDRLNILLDRFVGTRGRRYLDITKRTMIGVVYGLLVTALVQGTVAGIGFAIAGIPAAALLGLVTFLVSFIPVGPPLIWGAATIWLFMDDQIGMGIFMLLWGLMVSSIDNVIRPYFISLGSSLPLLLVLLGVFGGVLAFGFIGLFIGPTLLAVAYALVAEFSTINAAPSEDDILTGNKK